MDCEDDKVFVKPPPKVVRNTLVLFVVAMVQYVFLLVLLWFILARCYNCMWCSKCAVQTCNDNDLVRYCDPNVVGYYMRRPLYCSNLLLDAPRSLSMKRQSELRQKIPTFSCLFSWEEWQSSSKSYLGGHTCCRAANQTKLGAQVHTSKWSMLATKHDGTRPVHKTQVQPKHSRVNGVIWARKSMDSASIPDDRPRSNQSPPSILWPTTTYMLPCFYI